MSPEKLSEHAPTAVQRNPNDQRTVENGETGVDSPEAKENLERVEWNDKDITYLEL